MTAGVERLGFNSEQMYEVTRCRDCPNAVINMDIIDKACKEYLQQTDFSNKQRSRLGGVKPKQHDIFKIAIAGCPNSCSQPQIKDFGIQGQAIPQVGEGCTGCGLCVKTCPDGGITLREPGPQIDLSLCLSCGKCADCCPTGAITINQIGYRVIRGGKLGRRPMLAREVYSLTDEEGVISSLDETIKLLHQAGRPGERLGTILQRLENKE